MSKWVKTFPQIGANTHLAFLATERHHSRKVEVADEMG